MLKIILKTVTAILISMFVTFIVMIAGAIIFQKTDVGEGIVRLTSIISTAAMSIITAYLLSRFYKIKKIYSVVLSFLLVLIIKIVMTIIIEKCLQFSIATCIGIGFTLLFSLVGALFSTTDKK